MPTVKCPACGSPNPRLHPAVQVEGEVQPCTHPFHLPVPTKGVTDARDRLDWLKRQVFAACAPLAWATDGSDGSAFVHLYGMHSLVAEQQATLQEMSNEGKRRERARMHSAALREVLNARFDDGAPILEWILLADPDLKKGLQQAFRELEPVVDWKAGDRCHNCGSTRTGWDPGTGAFCHGCGASDADDTGPRVHG